MQASMCSGKSADSDEVVPYFILFKFQLFFIGERLKLAAAALAVEGAGGLNTKRRRHKYLLQLCIGIVFLRFHDLHLYRVADNRIFDKQNKTVGFPIPSPSIPVSVISTVRMSFFFISIVLYSIRVILMLDSNNLL